jgi:hypothetical protein
MAIVLVNDIDGNAVHTVAHGEVSKVREIFSPDHPVQGMITEALATGEACGTYVINGDQYTTRVVVEGE